MASFHIPTRNGAVAAKFFDKDFDAVKDTIECMPGDLFKFMDMLPEMQTAYDEARDAVHAALTSRIEEHHSEFEDGSAALREADLQLTSSLVSAQNALRHLHTVKTTLASASLHMAAGSRKRARLTRIQDVQRAALRLLAGDDSVRAALRQAQFTHALAGAQELRQAAGSPQLAQFSALKPALTAAQAALARLPAQLEGALSEMITQWVVLDPGPWTSVATAGLHTHTLAGTAGWSCVLGPMEVRALLALVPLAKAEGLPLPPGTRSALAALKHATGQLDSAASKALAAAEPWWLALPPLLQLPLSYAELVSVWFSKELAAGTTRPPLKSLLSETKSALLDACTAAARAAVHAVLQGARGSQLDQDDTPPAAASLPDLARELGTEMQRIATLGTPSVEQGQAASSREEAAPSTHGPLPDMLAHARHAIVRAAADHAQGTPPQYADAEAALLDLAARLSAAAMSTMHALLLLVGWHARPAPASAPATWQSMHDAAFELCTSGPASASASQSSVSLDDLHCDPDSTELHTCIASQLRAFAAPLWSNVQSQVASALTSAVSAADTAISPPCMARMQACMWWLQVAGTQAMTLLVQGNASVQLDFATIAQACSPLRQALASAADLCVAGMRARADQKLRALLQKEQWVPLPLPVAAVNTLLRGTLSAPLPAWQAWKPACHTVLAAASDADDAALRKFAPRHLAALSAPVPAQQLASDPREHACYRSASSARARASKSASAAPAALSWLCALAGPPSAAQVSQVLALQWLSAGTGLPSGAWLGTGPDDAARDLARMAQPDARLCHPIFAAACAAVVDLSSGAHFSEEAAAVLRRTLRMADSGAAAGGAADEEQNELDLPLLTRGELLRAGFAWHSEQHALRAWCPASGTASTWWGAGNPFGQVSCAAALPTDELAPRRTGLLAVLDAARALCAFGDRAPVRAWLARVFWQWLPRALYSGDLCTTGLALPSLYTLGSALQAGSSPAAGGAARVAMLDASDESGDEGVAEIRLHDDHPFSKALRGLLYPGQDDALMAGSSTPPAAGATALQGPVLTAALLNGVVQPLASLATALTCMPSAALAVWSAMASLVDTYLASVVTCMLPRPALEALIAGQGHRAQEMQGLLSSAAAGAAATGWPDRLADACAPGAVAGWQDGAAPHPQTPDPFPYLQPAAVAQSAVSSTLGLQAAELSARACERRGAELAMLAAAARGLTEAVPVAPPAAPFLHLRATVLADADRRAGTAGRESSAAREYATPVWTRSASSADAKPAAGTFYAVGTKVPPAAPVKLSVASAGLAGPDMQYSVHALWPGYSPAAAAGRRTGPESLPALPSAPRESDPASARARVAAALAVLQGAGYPADPSAAAAGCAPRMTAADSLLMLLPAAAACSAWLHGAVPVAGRSTVREWQLELAAAVVQARAAITWACVPRLAPGLAALPSGLAEVAWDALASSGSDTMPDVAARAAITLAAAGITLARLAEGGLLAPLSRLGLWSAATMHTAACALAGLSRVKSVSITGRGAMTVVWHALHSHCAGWGPALPSPWGAQSMQAIWYDKTLVDAYIQTFYHDSVEDLVSWAQEHNAWLAPEQRRPASGASSGSPQWGSVLALHRLPPAAHVSRGGAAQASSKQTMPSPLRSGGLASSWRCAVPPSALHGLVLSKSAESGSRKARGELADVAKEVQKLARNALAVDAVHCLGL